MRYRRDVVLKDGSACLLRSAEASDARECFDVFQVTHAETDYLLSYPDENSLDEGKFADELVGRAESLRCVEVCAVVGGKIVGTASVDSIGRRFKNRHRCELGISILCAYWGRGIGRALMEAASSAPGRWATSRRSSRSSRTTRAPSVSTGAWASWSLGATRWLSALGRPAGRSSCSCGWSFRGVGESSGGVTGCLRAFPCTEVPSVRVISIPACRSPLRVSPFRGLAEYLEFANWAFVIDGRPKTPKGAKTGSHEGGFCTNFWKTLARRGLLRRATPHPTGFGGAGGASNPPRTLPDAQKALEVLHEAPAVAVGEGRGALGAPSCPAHLLLLGTDEQIRVYGDGAVDASPHANGPGAAPQDHRGQADVLGDHDVSRLQGLHDGKVRRVGAGAHGQRVNPEAAPGMRGVAWVSRPDVPLQVLRGVSRNDHRHARAAGHHERVSRDGTGIGVDEEGHRGSPAVPSRLLIQTWGTPLRLPAKRRHIAVALPSRNATMWRARPYTSSSSPSWPCSSMKTSRRISTASSGRWS
nr:MAG TPA: GCN5-related N-acetyltransferase [Caudoviricetes sp.]